MPFVFLLNHEHGDDIKFIGIYETQEKADAARNRAKNLLGFRDFPEGFSIDRYELDKDHWTEGFVAV